jgi:hypothetical protein
MAKLELDDSNEFEWACMRMVEMNRRKRADYASDSDIFLNFRVNAQMMRLEGYDYKEDCLSMVCRKVNRITNLRGRDPQNETVLDSYEDLAVYATLLFAMALEEAFPQGPDKLPITIAYEGDDK